MLTNLDWLSDGAPFPPKAETARTDRYKQNELLFLSDHKKAWQDAFHDLCKALRRKNQNVDTVFNYQQLLSKKTADFVCGEPPTLETEQDTDALERLLAGQRFNTKLYEAVIDITRYGNAVVKIVGNRLSVVSPMHWFPVVDPSDLKYITHHVIAYPITPDAQGIMTQLYAEIHVPGTVERRIYKYDCRGSTIGNLESKETHPTRLDDFAVLPLTNVTHSGSIYGIDDYAIINSIVAKLMWRLHCADMILDKHSSPTMTGPSNNLYKDERTGLWMFQPGNFFGIDDATSPELKYVTWDGNLESNFKEIDKLLEQLYVLSEMGQAFMEGGGGGNASSGTALKLKMVAPRIKAARIANMNTDIVKQIIYLLAKVNGISINPDTLTLKWNDGLPVDEVEQTNTLVTATGGKAIMSQYAALKARGLTDAEVEAELEAIAEESARAQPIQLAAIDNHANEPTGGGEE